MTDSAPAHSRLSPSKAHTWTECTAALGYIRQLDAAGELPPERVGKAAIEGTLAHSVCEAMLKGETPPANATREMLDHGRGYHDFCTEVMGHKNQIVAVGIESRIPLYYLPAEKGTVDFWCINRRGLHLVDYKFGYGEVESTENRQMAIYARSLIESGLIDPILWEARDDTKVTMTIFQPRLPNETVTWRVTWKELREFTDRYVTQAAKDILGEASTLVFKASEKICKFCRAQAKCEAYNRSMLNDFDEIVPTFTQQAEVPEITAFSNDRLAELYPTLDKVDELIKAIREHVQGMVLSGKPMKGLKVVLSKGGHRRWTDESAAEKVLTGLGLSWDEAHVTSLISPAQAEKATKGKKGPKIIEMNQLMIKPPGSPIVVPENDPRPAHVDDASKDFDGIVDTEEFV